MSPVPGEVGMTVTEIRIAGRYRLGRSLGVGGMGRVWLARDEVLHRDVAIKEVALPFGLSDDEREELRARTLREARAAARLNHPNVVRIYDVVHGEEQPWIVMEYVRSRSLLDAVNADGPLPVAEVARIGLAVLAALEAAKRVRVLHRDVKPGNVLLQKNPRARMDAAEVERRLRDLVESRPAAAPTAPQSPIRHRRPVRRGVLATAACAAVLV